MTDEPRKIVCNEENRPPLLAQLYCTSPFKAALHAAVYENDIATFDYLVKHNVDLNCRNSLGETPLLMGIRRNVFPVLIKRLLDLRCDINITDEYGLTPLLVAILNRNVEIAQKLVERGADLDVQDLYTRATPLFYAIKNDDIEAVCMLLCYGADVTIKNAQNYTPLTYAIVNYSQVVVEILLDYCDDFNYIDNNGYTPLDLLIEYARRVFIQCGSNRAINYCFLEYGLDYSEADMFKKIWSWMNVDVLLETRNPLLSKYINSDLLCSANEWVECLYLMLESSIAIDLMDRCQVYYASTMVDSFFKDLLHSLHKRNVTSRDRQNIINICLTLGAEVTESDLDEAIQWYGFNEEFNTLVYATEHYRGDIIYHPLLHLIIGFSDLLNMRWWYGAYYVKLLMFSEESRFSCLFWERNMNSLVSCLGFISLTPLWKEALLQDFHQLCCQVPKLVEKIKEAREFPSLLELSRNRVHSLVREMRKAQKPYQFHDALKRLPLPEAMIDLLLFKSPIYE